MSWLPRSSQAVAFGGVDSAGLGRRPSQISRMEGEMDRDNVPGTSKNATSSFVEVLARLALIALRRTSVYGVHMYAHTHDAEYS